MYIYRDLFYIVKNEQQDIMGEGEERNGRPQKPPRISSLLTGLQVTPGVLVKVYTQVSLWVPSERMKEIGWFMVTLQDFTACFTKVPVLTDPGSN